MNYYLHRISHHQEWSYPLLNNKNLLSIGWAELGSQYNDLHNNPINWADDVQNAVELGRTRFWLVRFLRMEGGDRVVVPTRSRAFHVFEVVDDNPLVPNHIENDLNGLISENDQTAEIRDGFIVEQNMQKTVIDLGFFRRVNPIVTDIPRHGYADANLTSRMKALQANLDINDLSQSVDDAMNRYETNKPINLRSELMELCASKVLKTIVKSLTPEQFEKLIKGYFDCQGAIAEILPKNEREKEGDADVIATFDSLKLIVYVQAKRHDPGTETDAWAVEQIEAYTQYKNSRADDDFPHPPWVKIMWVISTAQAFSEDCRNNAEQAGVRLINGIEFAQLLLDMGIEHV